jgi:hypothetical protein
VRFSVRRALDLGFPAATSPSRDVLEEPAAPSAPRPARRHGFPIMAILIGAIVASALFSTMPREQELVTTVVSGPDPEGRLIQLDPIVVRWAVLVHRRDSLLAIEQDDPSSDSSEEMSEALFATLDTLSDVRHELDTSIVLSRVEVDSIPMMSSGETGSSSWARLGMGAGGAVIGVGLLSVLAAALRALKNPPSLAARLLGVG